MRKNIVKLCKLVTCNYKYNKLNNHKLNEVTRTDLT